MAPTSDVDIMAVSMAVSVAAVIVSDSLIGGPAYNVDQGVCCPTGSAAMGAACTIKTQMSGSDAGICAT